MCARGRHATGTAAKREPRRRRLRREKKIFLIIAFPSCRSVPWVPPVVRTFIRFLSISAAMPNSAADAANSGGGGADRRLVICLCGLPARGKTYISRKLTRYRVTAPLAASSSPLFHMKCLKNTHPLPVHSPSRSQTFCSTAQISVLARLRHAVFQHWQLPARAGGHLFEIRFLRPVQHRVCARAQRVRGGRARRHVSVVSHRGRAGRHL